MSVSRLATKLNKTVTSSEPVRRRRGIRTIVGLVLASLLAGGCSPTPPPTTATTFAVEGYVHAGPTCPTMQNPPDPNCADRPVPGAELTVLDADGTQVAQVRTDADGRFHLDLPAGTYTLVPQPVEGLLGTAPEQPFAVPAATDLDVAYDTGIR